MAVLLSLLATTHYLAYTPPDSDGDQPPIGLWSAEQLRAEHQAYDPPAFDSSSEKSHYLNRSVPLLCLLKQRPRFDSSISSRVPSTRSDESIYRSSPPKRL